MPALAGDDLTGENRARERGRGHPLAKTLNRFEPGVPGKPDRYEKVVADTKKMNDLQVDLFLDAPAAEGELFDSTDDSLHGNQEGRFFHGHCGCCRYVPPYVVRGDHVPRLRLRPSNVDGAAGEELARIVERQALARNQNRRSRRQRAGTRRGATTTTSTTCSACPATPA